MWKITLINNSAEKKGKNMRRAKSQYLFVIFAGPEQYGRPGTRYYTKDATVTDIKAKVAKFYSFESAKEFAEQNSINLTVLTYIGRESFSAFEISMD
jgi:hypothetical protein